MLDEDKPRFLAVLTGLAAVKPGAKLTPEALDVWWLAMKGWPLAEFEQAAAHLVSAMEFMPSPYHFNQLRKAGEPTAGEAFAKAREIMRRLPWDQLRSHQSGDGRLDAAIRACGGYEALAMCTTENIGFFERRFAEHFESMTEAESVRGALPNLTGGKRLNGPISTAKSLSQLNRLS